jgi:hypothetical protein
MKKLVILAALASSLITGSLRADPAARLAAFNKATGSGSNLLAITFGVPSGVRTNLFNELNAAGWSDDAVIHAARASLTAGGNAQVLHWAVAADGGMSEAFAAKLHVYVCANISGIGPMLAAQTAHLVPASLRPTFRDACLLWLTATLAASPPNDYPQPMRIALLVDKALAMDSTVPYAWGGSTLAAKTLQTATIEELVALRLAPEPRPSDEASIILDKATAGAKKQLRQEGKSFVITTTIVGGVTNVVNPLANKMQPVVEALNAPLMTGLEAALRGCGVSITIPHTLRTNLAAKATTWGDAILDGEIEPGAQAPYLNALKVSLGITNYNRFVDSYNNGAPR